MITAPVSRHLIVADVERSTAFYRDVLGFQVQPVQGEYGQLAVAEVVSGPARLQFGVGPAGPASLFFETDDVSATHAAIAARGGAPSAVDRVNWIKMLMFEVRDPDGHVIWFGQSFHEPTPPAPTPMLEKLLPEMPVDDVPAAVAHYRDVLGFRIDYVQHDIGIMFRDQATVLLIARTAQHTGIGSFYAYVRDADALHAELSARGANVLGKPQSMPWGLRQFFVLDLEGNRMGFGQTFE